MNYHAAKIYESHVSSSFSDYINNKKIKAGFTILDIGCGAGSNSRWFKERYPHSIIDGITASEMEAVKCREFMRRCEVVDLNNADAASFFSARYDLILMSHVLEHLIEPQILVRSALERLTKAGEILILLPNIAHFRLRMQFVFGEFKYQNFGALDYGHLRFFTFHSAKNFFSGDNAEVVRHEAKGHFPLLGLRKVLPNSILSSIDCIALRCFPNLFGDEIVLVVKKTEVESASRGQTA